MRNVKILGLLVLSALVGCSATEEVEDGAANAIAASSCEASETTSGLKTQGIQFNGMRMNGISLNGFRINGIQLNGLRVNGINLNGIRFNGINLNGIQFNGPIIQGPVIQGPVLNGSGTYGGVWLNGARLNGISLNGTHFTGFPEGTKITSAELEAELSDGSKLPVFIDRVVENPADAEVALYEVAYGADHQPLCGHDAEGKPNLATALANRWDDETGARIASPDQFTFACAGAALYKCVSAGYKPWKGAHDSDLHQACTRMVRADYCGDGTSFTHDGTLIDIRDTDGHQSFETMDRPNFAFEAAWGPDGATCIGKTRFPFAQIPTCVRDRLSDACETTSTVGLTNRSATDNACQR